MIYSADGIDHINIYSKGATVLGRFLTNFSKSHIEINDLGSFCSVEGLWYFLSTDDITEKANFRKLYGFEAKNEGKKIKNPTRIEEKLFQSYIKEAIKYKITNADLKMYTDFVNSTLPFTHYYQYGTKRIEPKQHQWIVEYISELRELLRNKQNINLNMIYAGIGSRDTPPHILKEMMYLAELLANKGYTLRSGGAIGADQAFENGYYRWFDNERNKVGSGNAECDIYLSTKDKKVIDFALKYHPNPVALSKKGDYVVGLMGRNAQIILGDKLDLPVDFVVCYTKDGKQSGGTGHAMKIAEYYNIPVYNLYFDEDVDELIKFLGI